MLDAIEPAPVASVHPAISRRLGVAPGGAITVASRRGSMSLHARADDGTPRGAVFIPFCYYEAAANLLTNPVLDPFGKIPEFKYCAVKRDGGRRCRHRASATTGTAPEVARAELGNYHATASAFHHIQAPSTNSIAGERAAQARYRPGMRDARAERRERHARRRRSTASAGRYT